VWTAEHTEIPIFAVTAYLLFLYNVIPAMKTRKEWPLKYAFAIWNLLLSIFSVCGTIRMIPYIIHIVSTKGFHHSVCEPAVNWYVQQAPGFWVMLFIYSKIPELLDTILLVLMKKEIIFLHWFHHWTVLLYCWHSFATRISAGGWFVGMNFLVHSFMYFYYFAMMMGFRNLCRRFNKFITTIQIVQMFGGSGILIYAAYAKYTGVCETNWANIKMGLVMYVVYAILFIQLFVNLYVRKTGRSGSPTKKIA